ncbi:hypothetical protein C8E03_105152 [Lachnotalea glycerini]|uniref:DUF3953 domain-containing protein n=1 Tax=Lachnotalea glycerini TaxID=1763509 RepID=A0A255IH68_9FIRM|nr:hypothetical protein [Lachnotalea glycerini]PXV90244.1 hypothetical protein C8E03_105152 [Lachnotalea glycerini]RDY30636.1 hypothetical protein CG710_013820 [Lachnotalea glycerini]
MKSKIKDNYFILDVTNVILCTVMLGMSIIALINIENNAVLFPYIILMGAIVNILAGLKRVIQVNKGKIYLFGGIFLFVISLMLFMGFGGF